MRFIPSLLCVLAVLSVCKASYHADGIDFTVNSKSAYCFYYHSSSISISNTNTFVNATSDNFYAYAAVYLSPTLYIDDDTDVLAECEPNHYSRDSCSTASDSFYEVIQGKSMYVMACLTCNYWFGGCNFDSFYTQMVQSFTAGYVTCDNCS
jgi:hypothetical protein